VHMGQGTSKNPSSHQNPAKFQSIPNDGDGPPSARPRKFLWLRLPGFQSQSKGHRPPAVYNNTETAISRDFTSHHSEKVAPPACYPRPEPSTFDWTLEEPEETAYDDVLDIMVEDMEVEMQLNNTHLFPFDEEKIPILKPQQKPKNNRYRDDSLFPRYLHRTPEARRERNLLHWRQVHSLAPPDGEHYLFRRIPVYLEIPEDPIGGQVIPPRTNSGARVQLETNTTSSIPASSVLVEALYEPAVGSSSTQSPSGPSNARLSMIVEEMEVSRPQDVQVVVFITAPYLCFAQQRMTSAKQHMRATWERIAGFLHPEGIQPPSTDQQYFSVAALLEITNQTFPFKIVLYLKELATRWNLREVARHYFDPSVPLIA
jgi:hypothetical protein